MLNEIGQKRFTNCNRRLWMCKLEYSITLKLDPYTTGDSTSNKGQFPSYFRLMMPVWVIRRSLIETNLLTLYIIIVYFISRPHSCDQDQFPMTKKFAGQVQTTTTIINCNNCNNTINKPTVTPSRATLEISQIFKRTDLSKQHWSTTTFSQLKIPSTAITLSTVAISPSTARFLTTLRCWTTAISLLTLTFRRLELTTKRTMLMMI